MSIMTSGAITTWIGYWTPTMVLGAILMAIGSGLLTTFQVETKAALWIIYQIIFALGIGLGFQQPIIAVQTAFTGADLTTALVMMTFVQTLGGIVAVSVAETIFTNLLTKNLLHLDPQMDSGLVQRIGVLNLRDYFSNKDLPEILQAYNLTITTTMLAAVSMACFTVIGAFGVPWGSVKSNKNEENSEQGDSLSDLA